MEFLPGGKDPKAGRRGCRVRPSRGPGMPHVEPVVLPKERSDLGRGVEDDQELGQASPVFSRSVVGCPEMTRSTTDRLTTQCCTHTSPASRFLLEQPDSRDPGCAGLDARFRIFQRDAAESEDWDLLPASPAQSLEACGCARRALFEDRPEDDEVCPCAAASATSARSVAGDANGHVSSQPVLTG